MGQVYCVMERGVREAAAGVRVRRMQWPYLQSLPPHRVPPILRLQRPLLQPAPPLVQVLEGVQKVLERSE